MDIKNKVAEIISKRVDITGLKEDDPLTTLGLDSLDLVEVMLEIEEEFGIEFASEEIGDAKTFKDVLKLIEKKI